MNVGILYGSSQKNDGKMKAVAQGLSEGIQSQGHRVDLIDMNLESGKIVSFYDYLVIGTNNTTFFGGKIPEVVTTFLKGAGTLSGKRCMAFITSGGGSNDEDAPCSDEGDGERGDVPQKK